MKKNHPTLRFSTNSYPTFGRKRLPFDESKPPKSVTDSPYYWWFMFLRLNKDYKATCEANGRGKYSEIYNDLGNVHAMNFKDWWRERAHLFAEPKKGYRMIIANHESEIAPFGSKDVVNLVVPLTWSQKSLKKAFSQLILKKIPKGKPGISVDTSEAKYRLSGKWNIEAFMYAYRIYQIKQDSIGSGNKLYWADIGIRAKLPYAQRENAIEGHIKYDTADLRATLTILANRHYKRALTFIESAASISFPYKVSKKARIGN